MLAGRIRLRQVPNKTAAVIEAFAKDCIAPGEVIRTDDGGEFETLSTCGYQHQPLPMRGDRSRMDAWLPLVSTVTGNLKVDYFRLPSGPTHRLCSRRCCSNDFQSRTSEGSQRSL